MQHGDASIFLVHLLSLDLLPVFLLLASGSLELFFLMLLLRFLLEVVHLALGACLSIPTSPSLCSLSSSHPSPAPPQPWPWWRTTPVEFDSIRQRGGHSSLVASKAACAHQKAWSFSLEPRSSQQGLGQMRDGDTGMLQNGQGLVQVDKEGLVQVGTRARRDGQARARRDGQARA